MRKLRVSEVKKLKSLAHHLDPVIIIGKHGVTPEVVTAIARALADHELIKVRFNVFKKEKRELAQRIREDTDSALIAVIGHVAIFYREHPEENKRKFLIKA